MNALYIQLWPRLLLIDPTGRGLSDAKRGVYFPIADAFGDESLLKNDVGGQLRLLKSQHQGKEVYRDGNFQNIGGWIGQELSEAQRLAEEKGDFEKSTTFFSKLLSKVWKKTIPEEAELDLFLSKQPWRALCIQVAAYTYEIHCRSMNCRSDLLVRLFIYEVQKLSVMANGASSTALNESSSSPTTPENI